MLGRVSLMIWASVSLSRTRFRQHLPSQQKESNGRRLSASQTHLNFTSLGFLFYYESQLLRSIYSESINTHPIIPQPLFLPRHLAYSIPTGRRNRIGKGNTEGACGGGNARYGVIEQWALLLRNAWPKVSGECKCFGQSPLPAYEPAFDWENERSMIFGQRTPETPVVHHGSFRILLVTKIMLRFIGLL
ncbi:hypothetical protein SLEP1_g46333 [Rubroshorea leprosula]|uniref:Uncharacterized protein n=1 Tax=Rubroshorea leprosula TaxID=152421 RepID=A0AAV5LM14_9ROSI|nr:hypothetical protein SLEP1_g46333 [Rubroshorea leprosula]